MTLRRDAHRHQNNRAFQFLTKISCHNRCVTQNNQLIVSYEVIAGNLFESMCEKNREGISSQEDLQLVTISSEVSLIDVEQPTAASLSQLDVKDETKLSKDSWISSVIGKLGGVSGKTPPKMSLPHQIVCSSVLAFCGILLISITDYWYLTPTFSTHHGLLAVKMLSGAHAATAVLLYEAYTSPLAQPRNVFGGYVISAFTGVSIRLLCQWLHIETWIGGPISVAVCIFAMSITKTTHPPGGACALVAVIGGSSVYSLGYGYILTSAGAAIIMLSVALIGNNLIPGRQYPQYWW